MVFSKTEKFSIRLTPQKLHRSQKAGAIVNREKRDDIDRPTRRRKRWRDITRPLHGCRPEDFAIARAVLLEHKRQIDRTRRKRKRIDDQCCRRHRKIDRMRIALRQIDNMIDGGIFADTSAHYRFGIIFKRRLFQSRRFHIKSGG
jgi:hypothetical protein